MRIKIEHTQKKEKKGEKGKKEQNQADEKANERKKG